MVKKIFLSFTILLSILICNKVSYAQIALLDEIKLMDNMRNEQLLGTLSDSSVLKGASFLYRSTSKYQFANKQFSKKIKIASYTFSDVRQTNNNLPQGFNDGNLYPALGLQERVSAGVNITWGAMDINLQPEWVTLENKLQNIDKGNQADKNWWTRYYFITANNIDHYRQFGKEPFNRFFLGQSRLGLSYPRVSFGISNENIWWGPGRRNSLMFTNNAAGFIHGYVQTNKPIKTLIGEFEINAIIGRLDSAEFVNPDDSIMRTIWSGAIYPKSKEARIMQAIQLVLQPKWVPNLYIGYAYSVQRNYEDSNVFAQEINVFSKNRSKTGLGVLMARFAMPKDHAEFYAEIGTPNQMPYPWKFFNDSSKTAFVVGAKKLFPNKNRKSYMEVGIELSQLEIMNVQKIFIPNEPFAGPQYNSFYTSPIIRQGHTHQGQLLGASIGPGSNSQTISISWNKGLNKIGAHFERTVYNNDFYNYVYLSTVGYGKSNARYVDITGGLEGQLHAHKNILIAMSVLNSKTMNWRWVRVEDDIAKWSEPTSKSPDILNLQVNVSVKFMFNGNR